MRRGRPPVGREQSEDRIDRLERLVESLADELRQARQQNTGTTSTQAGQTDGQHAAPPPPVPQMPPQPALYGDDTLTLIREFKKMKPPKFQGGIEPMKAEAWILEIEKMFEVFPSTAAQKCSISQDYRISDVDTGKQTVAEYDRAFTELARYAPHVVDNEYRKARKFEGGLRGPIQDQVNLLNMPMYAGVLDEAIFAEANLNKSQSSRKNQRKRQTYDNREEEANPNDAEEKTREDSPNNANQEGGTWPTCASCGKRHLGVCHRTTGACFGCGEMGHRIKDCSKVKAKEDKKR
ncbi:uncharacterized protein LOC114266589 [Camellia sinensis]|uniref:uncharacterized protein LOC114266589 n=1 Tax=Camellia sinensis TaxID=4442 RepID=UPI0010363DA0|nr:uncharacterized protein LOC114266589 [Camellia sinensis]